MFNYYVLNVCLLDVECARAHKAQKKTTRHNKNVTFNTECLYNNVPDADEPDDPDVPDVPEVADVPDVPGAPDMRGVPEVGSSMDHPGWKLLGPDHVG